MYAAAIIAAFDGRHRRRVLAHSVLCARMVLSGRVRAHAVGRHAWKAGLRAQGRDGQWAAGHSGGIVDPEPAARGRLSSVRLRLRDREHAAAARLQTPRRHRRRHASWCTNRGRSPGSTSAKLRRSCRRRPLAPTDQAAVIALAARAPRLTAERLDELAALAAAVSGDAGRSGPDVTRRVLGVAQWVLGRRS